MKATGILLVLVFCAATTFAQMPPFRYATATDSNGTTFFAMDGTTGQLHYLNDYGEERGVWKSYGNPLRGGTSNTFSFAAVRFPNGVVFYVIDAATGQLYFMSDYGDHAALWASYGSAIRSGGRPNLYLQAQPWHDGTRFTAFDGDTGQLYYMLDTGDDAGKWKPYGLILK